MTNRLRTLGLLLVITLVSGGCAAGWPSGRARRRCAPAISIKR